MKSLFLLFILSFPAFSQSFSASYPCSASSSSCVFTIQQPSASPTKSIQFVAVQISTDTAISATLETSTNVATTTTSPITSLDTPGLLPIAKAFSASNASTGVNFSSTQIPANSVLTISLLLAFNLTSGVVNGPAKSFTVRTSSFTGNCAIVVIWKEVVPFIHS